MTAIELLAAAVRERPHSFGYLRRTAGLQLTDKQFRGIVKEHPDRFKIVRFRRKDGDDRPTRPGMPGIGLRHEPR